MCRRLCEPELAVAELQLAGLSACRAAPSAFRKRAERDEPSESESRLSAASKWLRLGAGLSLTLQREKTESFDTPDYNRTVLHETPATDLHRLGFIAVNQVQCHGQ